MNTSKLKFLSAMGIFGTVGIFVKYIPISAAAIALSRGILGLLFLVAVMLLRKKRPDAAAVKQNLPVLLLSGIAMGLNWALLFESYRYTTVATATVCYYLAPLILLLASPLLGERLTGKNLLCVGAALVGLVCVSGIIEDGMPTWGELKGIALSVGAAVLYATVMLLNKKLTPIGSYDKTVIQLAGSVLVLLPYAFFTNGSAVPSLHAQQWMLLLVVGILHTGIAYTLYFGSIKDLKAQTIAVFSYLDPVIAVVLSALVLQEPLHLSNIIGTVLVLGSALYSQLPEKMKDS